MVYIILQIIRLEAVKTCKYIKYIYYYKDFLQKINETSQYPYCIYKLKIILIKKLRSLW